MNKKKKVNIEMIEIPPAEVDETARNINRAVEAYGGIPQAAYHLLLPAAALIAVADIANPGDTRMRDLVDHVIGTLVPEVRKYLVGNNLVPHGEDGHEE